MTKNSIIFSLFSLVFLFSSCINEEDNNIILDADGAYPYVEDVVTGFFDLANTADASTGFTVKTSSSGATEVNSITVMKSFNGGAKVEHATINGTEGVVSMTLAEAIAGLGVNEADLALGDEFSFTFVLNTNDSRALTSAVSVGVPMSCISDLAGMYSVTATYASHDFLADYPTNTMDVELFKVSDGVYMVEDFSGGLYGVGGPYDDAYGTGGFPVEFKDICNNISWSGQTDPWGDVLMQEGGVNSVDANGVITISWTCAAYGETGVCVYTPL